MRIMLDQAAFNAGVNSVLSFRRLRWHVVYWLLQAALFTAPRGDSRNLLIEHLFRMKATMLTAIELDRLHSSGIDTSAPEYSAEAIEAEINRVLRRGTKARS
ncbi:hypothetical protein ACEUZ9_005462 [Paracoccus litorisediminis]|uniref:hypothetical protein n=1 Tax=Paracoccus litorisediminis TaxID=2006130 RepID=UPI00372F7328